MGARKTTLGDWRLTLCALAASGCAELRHPPPDESGPATGPPATTLLWTLPSNPSQLSPRDGAVELCFSGVLSPDSVQDGVVHLSSGPQNFDSSLQLDLVDWRPKTGERRGSPPCPGSLLRIRPTQLLPAHTRYRLRINNQLRDWQGNRLDDPTDPRWISDEERRILLLEFQTGDAKIQPAAPDAPTRFADLFAPGAVFSPQSPACSCHQQAGPFDLRDPDELFHQLRFTDRRPDQPWLIPGFASHSYLIYKLLRDAQGHALRGVFGTPMPPSAPLAPEQMAQIIRWIDDGALP